MLLRTILLTAAFTAAGVLHVAADDRPNILWISAEDLSAATIGCYGGAAHTPHLDRLASAGLRFDAAFSAAPVCAPSRSAIITGMMPTTLGSLPMRCKAIPPHHVVGFPKLLRDAGYFCTNNAKTDYNLDRSFAVGWNESNGKAHWRHRPDGTTPFFAVFNLNATHESGLFDDKPAAFRRNLPPEAHRAAADVAVPPYYPDTPGIRRSLAQRMELAAAVDADVGRILADLAADGLADDTIVFFWGDHGEGIPHGKRSLTEHGLRVPLLVHVPERFAARAALPGSHTTRGPTSSLVSLMDLGPSVLALAGIAIPAGMEGRPFLGPTAASRDVVIAARDRMDSAPGFGRSVRDQRFRYVRNFLPWLDGDDLPPYADGVAITGELRAARKAGTLPPGASWFARTSRPVEELYDVATDPDELVNLAHDTRHAADLERLRETLHNWMRETKDTGILPEPILRREARAAGSEWAIFHPKAAADAAAAQVRYDAILAVAWDVAENHDATHFRKQLTDTDPAIRSWAVAGTGWAAQRDGSDPASVLQSLLTDPEPAVRIAAANWLVRCRTPTATDAALAVLLKEACGDASEIRLAALIAIDQLGDAARTVWPEAAAIEPGKDEEYPRRLVERLRTKLAN
jgi:arylsulfatase A-like enzyme